MKDVGTYFLLTRNIFDSAIWQERPIVTKIFIWLIGQARYEKESVKLEDVEIKRGELVTSLEIIADKNKYNERGRLIKLSRTAIHNILQELENKQYLTRIVDTYGTHIKICNYDIYQTQEHYLLNRSLTGSEQVLNRCLTGSDITKQVKQVNHLKQENIQTSSLSAVQAKDIDNREKKSSSKKFDIESIEYKLSELLLSLILKRKSDFKKSNLQSWAKNIDLMIRIDDRNSDKIKEVIEWCQKDTFWQNNILSTDKLRKQFDKLELQKTKTEAQQKQKPSASEDSVYERIF